MSKPKLLEFDSSAAVETVGITPAQLDQVWSKLEKARDEVLKTDVDLFDADNEIPPDKQPLDAGFIHWPDKLLSDYDENRETSELGLVLGAARRLSKLVDRVVVLGIGGSYMGAKALMDSCLEPYFNELSRAQRGGRPRIYFAGNNVDNDRTQGLLQLLQTKTSNDPVENRWGIVVISKSGGTMETAVAFRQFYSALEKSVDDAALLPQLVVPVTGSGGKLDKISNEIGCVDKFEVPDGIGGRFSVLTAVGLLPAAIMGLDVVNLLRGAWMMNSNFAEAGQGSNPVMDYVAINHLLEVEKQMHIRVLSAWSDSFETTGFWYDQLLSESLGKNQKGATPITAVNTRDLHSRAQQHQEGTFDKVFNNLIIDQWRFDYKEIDRLRWDHDNLNRFSDLTLPDLMNAAIAGTNQALAEDRRPTTEIRLPMANENGLGQLFQMLMLATVLEGRLLGINPYGQPGVEKYKTNMNKILQQKIESGVAHAH